MNKKILRLAIPNIVSNLSIPLLSSVDIALMGKQDSAAYIGALTVSTMVFSLIYFCFS
jgi:MATE family multidrug resistance protein